MADPLEIELKLEVAFEDRERLNALPLLADGSGKTDHLLSTYFDTPGLHLLDAGYSLRVRRTGKGRVQTVKADSEAAAGLFVRPEWERSIDGDLPVLDETSGPLTQLLGEEAIARLAPLFVTEVHRTARAVAQGGSRIELAVDRGEIRAGARRAPLCEVELELEEGPAQALFDLAREIDAEVPLRLGVRSKSERGYDLASGRVEKSVKTEPIRLEPDCDAQAAFQAIARACMRQFRLNEALLLETGDKEPLHQARVGLRRLRSAFSLHRRLLAMDSRVRRLKEELRWLAAALGEVRNIDVLIPRIGEKDVSRRLVAERARMFEEVRAALMSPRARLLMIDLAEWLALGDWRARPADPELLHQPAALFAGDVLDLHRKRLKRQGRKLAELDDEHRHRVRIEAKKLRYASEFFAGLYVDRRAGRRHRAFLDALEALQDHLGDLNDHATGAAVLARLGLDAKLSGLSRREQARLIDRAEEAYETLIDVKRFWR
ncbi:CYTH and CHAD domain-containing protein [Sphingomonas oligoaromativorans]|uniref:CYTH and CHAD domain-containing protein n=1 Tax=Sphingomonas oligoaromativorans TaxID=575322 RepID=UPI0014208723|nr:CYTH and CHAD domain-containing protein [Sphingomonas oligoaromativorans]NIJ33532.1 inorganic triphosphatase YgiF [Sphingomonas oligoaromativorans]